MKNQLSNAGSLYLRQHKDNPVNWQLWSAENLRLAKERNLPILLSIGYASCHWCHVMEKESFENEEVGRYMNEHFTCIKIDREEYPDVDEKYMQVVQAMTGQGGWPLNVFLTPDMRPIFGGTYFPPEPMGSRPSWMQILQRITVSWEKEQDLILAQSQKIIDHLNKEQTENETQEWNDAQLLKTLSQGIDLENGGFFRAPKFPLLMAWEWLYDLAVKLKDEETLTKIKNSMSKMLMGGVFDQVNGGMMRYSTDDTWTVPHFEKMLYTQSNLLGLLSKLSSQNSSELLYHCYLQKTNSFLEEGMQLEDGFYASAFDADTADGEGYYYSFTYEEAQKVLEEEALMEAFGVTEQGNFESRNIIHFSDEKRLDEYEAYLREFGEIQKNRTAPERDEKKILSWNASLAINMARAYIHSSDTFYQTKFQALLAQCSSYVQRHEDGSWSLYRIRYSNGQYIEANGEDYAYFALLNLYAFRLNQKDEYFHFAEEAVRHLEENYSSEGLFSKMKNSDSPSLMLRQENDTTLASVNGLMHEVYTILSLLDYSTLYKSKAETIANKMKGQIQKYPHYYGFLGQSISAAAHMRCVHTNASWDQIPAPLPMKYWLKKRSNEDEKFQAEICASDSCERNFSSAEDFSEFIRDQDSLSMR